MQNDAFEPITASLVAEDRRLDFLPACFGLRRMIRGETLMYKWLNRLCADYQSGYWHYYELSNGGFYMAPDLPGRLHIEVKTNGFGSAMSADAAGIVATLFALCQLAEEMRESKETSEADALIDRYYLLRDFALKHVERDLIFQAID